MMRRDELCPGADECPYAWQEGTGGRCEECPATLLDDYLASPKGQLIQQTLTLDFALRAGVTVSLQEISYPEFLLLRVLSEERARYQGDLMKKQHGR
ncbi:MAG TPA: hypothetical protein VHT68_15745 [Pseudolabrys sp.]|jgi:hypothetical protein|nr:hypothetical protein [Pseudolabrys sp.]